MTAIPLIKVAKRKYDRNYVEKKKTDSGGVVRIYDENHVKNRWKKKVNRLKRLNSDIKKLRKKYYEDLKSDNPKTAATAAMVGLMDLTAMRVGNPDSADEFETYGASTLQKKHAKVSGNKIRFRFLGKANVQQDHTLTDARLVRAIKKLLDGKKGKDLIFEYEEGKSVSAKIANRYLAEFDITNKDLRGFHANRIMKEMLKKHDWDEALELAAEEVGHTPATLSNQYLDPAFVKKHKPKKEEKKDKDKDKKGTKKRANFGVPMMKAAAEEISVKVWGYNLGDWTFQESGDYPPEAEYHLKEFSDIHSALTEAKRLIGPGKKVFVNTWKSEVGPKGGRVIRSWSSEDGAPLQEKRVRANPHASAVPAPWQGDFKDFIRSARQIPLAKSARWSLSEEQAQRRLALEAAIDRILGPQQAIPQSKRGPVLAPAKTKAPSFGPPDSLTERPRITSDFGDRANPSKPSERQFHKGLDIGYPKGTPVTAIEAGEVTFADWQDANDPFKGYGRVVYIKHPSGHVSRYAHLDKIDVSQGDSVTKGQQIGLSGASGNATRDREHPHLHLEIRDPEGNAIDPAPYFYGKGIPDAN